MPHPLYIDLSGLQKDEKRKLYLFHLNIIIIDIFISKASSGLAYLEILNLASKKLRLGDPDTYSLASKKYDLAIDCGQDITSGYWFVVLAGWKNQTPNLFTQSMRRNSII